MWFRALIATVGVFTVASSASSVLAAEPSAADKETSRALYAQGMQALDAHDYAAAERACGGVFKLVNVPPGAVCWGKALEGLGKFVEARDAYLAAAHFPPRPDEPPVFTAARVEGQSGADRLEKRIATIVLDVSGAKDGAPLRVTIDDVGVAPDLARLPRRVNPGHHVVVVASPGYRTARLEVAVAEGQESPVKVALVPGEASAEGATPSAAPPTRASSKVPNAR